MTDIIDRAQVIEEFRRDLAVHGARAGSRRLLTPGGFGLCEDCADPIDAERRAAAPGARRCFLCQEQAERRLRTHATR